MSGPDHAFAPVASDAEAGFGIYVHWPFCAAKCPYCDFNSHVRAAPIDQPRYVRAFEAELRTMAQRTPGRRVSSIFFGGGTPSLMEPSTVGAILRCIEDLWDVEEGAEVTLEANPTSVEADRFAGFRREGVNRVSLGVQAMNDKDLDALGRKHSVAEALRAVGIARGAFDRVSFDLIYARPGQSIAQWEDELCQALDLAADHLSLYQLTIEPGTQFEMLYKAGRLEVPDPEVAEAMFLRTQALTANRDLAAYEISNHAASGAACQHNLVYWRYGEYVGVGPGAHGRLVRAETDFRQRIATSAERYPEHWLARVEQFGHGLTVEDPLTAEEMGDEYLVMGLRLREGISRQRYEALSGGRQFDERQVALMIEQGFIESDGGDGLRATREGSFLLDAVVADLAA
ncbi:MAG: coproporphyrinogen III oxidase [Devosiaceae bacterium]|nr:coproporphyrinogen III oxidase [Devosiaceae bacterium MH13]